jgi:Leucine-rich repeat (LRR) protein
MSFFYQTSRNIDSLEELVDEIGNNNVELLICDNVGLKSLKGIKNLPTVKKLCIPRNLLTSLEELSESNVENLCVDYNQIQNLGGLVWSKIKVLYAKGNPCYKEWEECHFSIDEVKEKYSFDIKEPVE